MEDMVEKLSTRSSSVDEAEKDLGIPESDLMYASWHIVFVSMSIKVTASDHTSRYHGKGY